MMLRVSRLALCLVAACQTTAAAEEAPQPLIRSLDVAAATPADAAVVRGLWTSRPGADFRAEAVAADLYRLGVVGCIPARFAARFDDAGVALSLEAAPADKPLPPVLATVEPAGGVPEVDRRCRPLLGQKESTLFEARRINYRTMLRDAALVEREYRAAGYLDARVRALELVGGSDPTGARLVIRVEPGKRFVLGDVQVRSGSVDAGELRKALDVAAGTPWNEELQGEALRRAVRFCRERGYLAARATAAPKPLADGAVELQLNVDEGERAVLNRVTIEGAGDLHDEVLRRVALRPGEPISPSAMDALRRSVEEMGTFTRIELLLAPPPDAPAARRDLVVRLTRFDPARDVGAAEELCTEMAKSVIRLYNSGGLRSFRLSGFTAWEGRRIHVDAALVRPGWSRLRITLGDGNEPRREFLFLRKGRRTVVVFPALGRALELPESVALRFRFAILPPDADSGTPTRIDLGAAVTGGAGDADVLLLGPRCPPVAAHFTKLARSFALSPPQFDAPGILSFADPDDAQARIRLAIGPDRLPRLLTRRGADGHVTARLEIDINAEQAEPEPSLPADADRAAGRALMAPVLFALGLTDAAARMAEEAVAEHPESAACLAVRGLARLASGPPEPGLADLRAAHERSAHPAYALLLAETLISGRRFREAADLCGKLLASGAKPAATLDPADLILAANISVHSAIETLTSGPPDYRRRAAADCALARVGLGEYEEAARLAAGLLTDAPGDPQAAEMLARCRLSLGQPDAALDAVSKVDAGTRNAQLDVYAALAHLMRSEAADAALALGRAARKAPATARNLLLLQERAAEIHERFKDAAAAAALARAFDRAERTLFPADPGAKPAAFVNGVVILESDVEALMAQAGDRDADLRERALNQLVEDALVIRWAVSHGAVASDEDVGRVLAEEARAVGLPDVAAYGEWLEANGGGLAARRTAIAHSILKREAFSRVLAEAPLVRPAEVRAYYDEHPAEFRDPTAARFRMITLEYRRFQNEDQAVELAAALLRRLREKPDDFAETAKQYSHDANRDSGGLWQDVTRGSLVAPLDDAVFGAKAGDVVGPLRTEKACHVFRVEEVSAERTLSLEEAAPRIVRKLHGPRARAEIAAWIQRLKARSHVEIVGATSSP